jgi:phage terminase large subunit-like protein
MVSVTIGTIPNAPYTKLITASRGKYTRAEPIAMLSQQHMIHHVGTFAKLEDELCSWTPGQNSPNRLDAYVWLCTELGLGGTPGV